MTIADKISFLENSLKLNDKEFAKRYKINFSLLRKMKLGKEKPTPENVKYICKDFKLDPNDFLDDSSTLQEPGPSEHACIMVKEEDRNNVIYEDFAREDNSRYEEKD